MFKLLHHKQLYFYNYFRILQTLLLLFQLLVQSQVPEWLKWWYIWTIWMNHLIRVVLEVGSVTIWWNSGNKRWLQLPVEHIQPVQTFEPLVILDVISSILQVSNSLGSVYHKQFSDQILGHILYTLGPINFSYNEDKGRKIENFNQPARIFS